MHILYASSQEQANSLKLKYKLKKKWGWTYNTCKLTKLPMSIGKFPEIPCAGRILKK